MKIILCGPPCSGKSTIAPMMASILGWDAIDTDQIIEEEYYGGKSCREIYRIEGEEQFRSREHKALLTVDEKENVVIALGGGVTDVSFLQTKKLVIYLQTSIDTLWERIKSRPQLPAYLSNDEPKKSLEAHVSHRLEAYRLMADVTICTDHFSPEEVVEKLKERCFMGSNSFGNLFRITTWGESHGKAIGVVIDGCPAGLPLDETMIQDELDKRAPGKTSYTSPRKETDCAEIFSGVFEGQTTGTPIMIMIKNEDVDSSKYEPIKNQMRPGHANYTYLEKYGIFDWRGGGRSSGRETACRVAAGAVAKKLLERFNIEVSARVVQIGRIKISCPQEIKPAIGSAIQEGDSIGGLVQFVVDGLPSGFGDPVYEKLEANLAKAMLSIPASKGFEIGEGFAAATMLGSEHNDPFHESETTLATNHAGGTLGGISTGMPLTGRVAFKPTSSIMLPQKTVDTQGKETNFQLPKGSRHDPCIAIRAAPVVEAMAALVVADALLMNRSSKLWK